MNSLTKRNEFTISAINKLQIHNKVICTSCVLSELKYNSCSRNPNGSDINLNDVIENVQLSYAKYLFARSWLSVCVSVRIVFGSYYY